MVEAAIHGVKIMGKVLHDNNKLSTGQEKPPFISIWQSITNFSSILCLSFKFWCILLGYSVYFVFQALSWSDASSPHNSQSEKGLKSSKFALAFHI